MIRENEKGTCMLTDNAMSGDGRVIKKEGEKILKDLNSRNTAHMECKNNSNTSNSMAIFAQTEQETDSYVDLHMLSFSF